MAAVGIGVFASTGLSPMTIGTFISRSNSKVFPAYALGASNKQSVNIPTKNNMTHIVSEKKTSTNNNRRLRLKDYFEQSEELVSRSDGGPPRWFSPLECGSRLKDSPLLLYLSGNGVGLGLILHHERLGKFFDIWCLHIPISDRTSFIDLVKLVESAARLEHLRLPNRPIYLAGESFGACLALSVAARNPDIDLVLILANPGTSFNRSLLQPQNLIPFSIVMPEQLQTSMIYMLTLLSGALSKMVGATMRKGLPLQHIIGELSQDSAAMLSYLSVLSDVSTVETLCWKLNMLKSAAAFANTGLHAVKAQTLILTSGKDQLFPSREEGERLGQLLPKCEIRTFDNSGHALFLEDGINLVPILTGSSFYRRGKSHNYVLDFLPPSPYEFQKLYEPCRWMEAATDPVMLSTQENGKIVRSLAEIPSEGPVLFVGYHMMLACEIYPMLSRFWTERNIVLRGVAHPMMFAKLRSGKLPAVSSFDALRSWGAVPVSAANFYRLFASKSHVLLYPGGTREALHRKGEEYKLFWPEQSEFVRMASRFGAKIVPFGVVGEDDIGQVLYYFNQLLLDYDDQKKIPYFKALIEELNDEVVKLRSDAAGEVANQDLHYPIILPKIPGRFYYYFGKPIQTEGRKHELGNREKAHELYLEVKSEVENCLDYLKKKRENDPYRNIFARLAYQATHGFDSDVPTFDF